MNLDELQLDDQALRVLIHLIAIGVEREREACAQIADQIARRWANGPNEFDETAAEIAVAIRNRPPVRPFEKLPWP